MQIAQTELRETNWPDRERVTPMSHPRKMEQTAPRPANFGPTGERPPFPKSQGISLGKGCLVIPSRLDAPQTEYALPSNSNFIACAQHSSRRIIWQSGSRSEIARIRRGFIALIPANAGGRLHCADAISISSVILSSERLSECANGLGYDQLPALQLQIAADDQRLAALVGMLTDFVSAGDTASQMLAEQCLDLLCAHLLAHHGVCPKPVGQRQKRGLAEWQIDRISDYIQAHIDEAISLDDLAQQVGLSRFHFCTAFRIATGQTPYEWLTAKRMECAEGLLACRNLTITEIGLSVGYETPSSFTARFRRQMGMTPTEFRRRAGTTAIL